MAGRTQHGATGHAFRDLHTHSPQGPQRVNHGQQLERAQEQSVEGIQELGVRGSKPG